MHRRQFLRAGLAAVAVGSASRSDLLFADASKRSKPDSQGRPVRVRDRICLFTDHLDDFGYSYKDVASMLRQLDIAGPDLTVRPGGLVAPERVAEELPRAAAAFQDEGLSIPMISTGLTSVDDPAARPTLTAMKTLGIRYYKLGYQQYEGLDDWQSQIEAARKKLAGLVELGKAADVVAGLHNHSGPFIGGALWDGWELLRPLDAKSIGFYFDPAQATIEGGKHGWKLGFGRLAPRLKMVAIKDFVWEKTKGEWRTRWCPLGEGMVRWPEFFELLAKIPFDGPVSLHIEYDPGGRTRAERFENSLAAAERDLKFLKSRLQASSSTGG